MQSDLLRLKISDYSKENLGEAIHTTSRKFMDGPYSVVLYQSISLVDDRIYGAFLDYFRMEYNNRDVSGKAGISLSDCKKILQNWSHDNFMEKVWSSKDPDDRD
jgi:hypothetical protein